MNYMNIRINQHIVLRVFLALIISSFSMMVYAQGKEGAGMKNKKITMTLVVTDETGKPMSDVDITVGEGVLHQNTDSEGSVTVEARPNDRITVYVSGYEKETADATYYLANSKIVLKKSTYLASADDVVKLPYFKSFRRYSIDNRSTLTGEKLERYPGTDVRNAFVGLVPGLEVAERDGQPGTQAEEYLGSTEGGNFSALRGYGDKVNFYARGTRPIVVIDDIEIDLNEMAIDPQEIESVTVIKDAVAKAMYGPRGTNGIIFIRTKRGHKNERILSVNAESGIQVVDRMPRFVGGVDYALMNNEARKASGYPELYDEKAIEGFGLNDPYNVRYPNNDYRSMLFKDSRMYRNLNVSSMGGNDKLQYFAYLGYSGEDDNFKVGPSAGYNRLNARSNIDVAVNDFIKLQFDFFANISLRNSPNYGYDSNFGEDDSDDGELDLHEMNSLLEDMRTIAPVAFPVYAVGLDGTQKGYALSNDFSYGRNPVGALLSNGYYTEQNRMGNSNVALDIDLNHIVKGLKSRTYLGFNVYNLIRLGKTTEYDAFALVNDKYDQYAGGDNTITDNDLWVRKRTATTMSSEAKLHDYYAMRFSASEAVTFERVFGKHAINAAAVFNYTRLLRNQIEEPLRTINQNLVAQYVFDEKYVVNGTLNYAGASFYPEDNRFKLFPTVGAGWILSEESFLKDVSWLNFLKIRGEYGYLGSPDYKSYYNYDDKWSSGDINAFGRTNSSFGTSWMGSTSWTAKQGSYNRISNYNLTWATRKEFTTGFEAIMFKNKLTLDFGYYNILREGDIETIDNLYPLYYGMQASPYLNFGSTRYFGGEGTVKWQDKLGEVKYSLAGMANLQRGKRLIVDEVTYPENESYRYSAGTYTGAIWGQTYAGRYATDEEAMAATNQNFDDPSKLRAGDLKYTDLNGDGQIDDRDSSPIGNSSPLMLYSFNLGLEWKNFEFWAVGAGAAFFDINLRSYNVFTTNAGSNNYSEWVRDNRGGAFPRLTYDNVNSNNQTSAFWLRDGGYFKIQNVELAYNLPVAKSSGLRGVRIFVRGANLMTFSGIDEIDPEAGSSGITRYPLNRTFTGGFKLTF